MDSRDTGRSQRILGLTGPIGCGKTTVGDILLELGAVERIDADRVVHSLMQPGTALTAQISETFGRDVLAEDGSVNRAALGRIVFGDVDKLRLLESMTHPAVRHEIRRRLAGLAGAPGVVVIDAVKLLQSDLLPLVDSVWVVTCSHDVEMRRLVERRSMTCEDAAARVAAQPSFDHPKVSQVVDNNASLVLLRDKVERAWAELIAPT